MKRPFKVRWWSSHWNDWLGKSFAYEDRALAYAKKIFEEGGQRVTVWENDENGIVKRTIWEATKWLF